MRILVISNLFPPHAIGGYEERCRQCTEFLARQGHEVAVLTSNHTLPTVTDSDRFPFPVHRLLRVHGFFGHPWLPIHKLFALESHNHRATATVLANFAPEVIHVWNMGGISKSLLHRLEAHAAPVVYDVSDHWIARSLRADVWLDWWNAEGSRARRLLRGMLAPLRRRIDRIAPTAPVASLRFASGYFCSRFLRDLTASKGFPVHHFSVIYCGVPTDSFAHKSTFNPPRHFLWVGRLAEDKDPLTPIRALALARQRTQLPLQLSLFGKGEPAFRAVLDAEVHALNLADAVHFRSASSDAMRGIYAQFDALIFSSNWGEPFALTPLEAMASHLPVIMCPDGGDAELLQHGHNAFGFTAASPDSLADAIAQFVSLPDAGQSVAHTAAAEVNARFSIASMSQLIEAALHAAVHPERE